MKQLSIFSILLAGAFVCRAQMPKVADGGIVNGASFAKGQPVSPGGLISIFGTGLASNLATADTIPLSNRLSGVTVTFADLPPAPLLAVIPGVPGQSDDQINAQLPWEIGSGTGTVNVMVTTANGTSAAVAVNFVPSMPGIFTSSAGGQLYAIAVNSSDSSLAWPQGLAGSGSHPAKAGDILIIYATGLGAVDHQPADGGIPSVLAKTIVTPTVLIGGVEADVQFSGLAPQFVGVNQLNVQVPPGVAAGSAVPLQINVNGFTSTNQAVVAIQ
ncbi:MAG: hypothetical protein JOZ32_18290 [Bryobacterales bacterium]|nr:hypothetical protein [Bryobacterales bacterium]